MEQTIQHNGAAYRVTKPLRPFAVGIPHQRPAFTAYPEQSPPVESDGDRFIEGDHDLHAVYLVETLADALPLLEWKDERGGQSRHQAIRIAALLIAELFDQGVLEEQAETYSVYRGWLDGEVMEPHKLAGPFASLDVAVRYVELRGGYVKRESDGAVYTPGTGWITEGMEGR